MKSTSTRRLALLGALAIAGATAVVAAAPQPAAAHGGLTFPATRTYACYVDAIAGGTGGGLNPQNEMCRQLLAENGNYPFYNWFGNLLSNADGRHREVVADGLLCGPGPQFSGVNTPGDWPTTQVQPGQQVTFQYNAWARHPGRFDQYVTKDGWDPSQPLAWDDLEPVPFDSVVNPPLREGGPEGAEYYWDATLPDKQGQHIIYSVWTRSDSPEAFYNCSDVNFGGDTTPPPPPPDDDTQAPTAPGTPTASTVTGTSATLTWPAATDDVAVTGYVVQDAASGATLATTAATTATLQGLSADTAYSVRVVARDAAGNTSAPSAAATFRTTAESSSAQCSVDYEIASAWPGGFVANVTVHNDSMSPIDGWQLGWTFSGGERVTNAWGGTATQSGTDVTVGNAPWNATIGHHGSVSFGFQGTTTGGAPQVPTSFTLDGTVCE